MAQVPWLLVFVALEGVWWLTGISYGPRGRNPHSLRGRYNHTVSGDGSCIAVILMCHQVQPSLDWFPVERYSSLLLTEAVAVA